jgi:poly-beta-1,6-N-acetyl-D-glucosamine biosynthesis protein PgaD
MGKSGQGDPQDSIIIDRPELKSTSRLVIEGMVTTTFWGLFLYSLAPIVTILLWFFGIKIIYFELIEQQEFWRLLKMLKQGSFLILIILLVYWVWIYHNILLLRRRGERRCSRAPITLDEDLAKSYRVDLNLLTQAKTQSRLRLSVKKEGLAISW